MRFIPMRVGPNTVLSLAVASQPIDEGGQSPGAPKVLGAPELGASNIGNYLICFCWRNAMRTKIHIQCSCKFGFHIYIAAVNPTPSLHYLPDLLVAWCCDACIKGK
jgi:hypothetical protein